MSKKGSRASGRAVLASAILLAAKDPEAAKTIAGDAPSAAVQEMERLARLHDDVMRVMSIKVDAHEEGPSVQMQKRDDREDRGDRGIRGIEDYFRTGRNLENLGLAGLGIEEIELYARTGRKP